MWAIVREHLIAKLAVVLLATLILGFGLPAVINARIQLAEMQRSGHASAESVAQGLAAGVRTAMLSGNGITARTMVHDARTRLGTLQVHIYAPSGEEVFGVVGPPPEPAAMPAHVRDVLGSARALAVAANTTAIPIPNEARCRKCHAEGELRGVLTLGTDGAKVRLGGGDETLDVLNGVARSAFVQIMTADKDDDLEPYFEELAAQVEGIEGVAVFDPEGEHSLGNEAVALDPAILKEVLASGSPRTLTIGGKRLRVQPLANDPQCHACHEESDRFRGAIVTAAAATLPDPRTTVLEAADVSMRHVMLSGLGRMIARFLDEVAATGAVSTLTLHDGEGRLFRDAFSTPSPPFAVEQALKSGDAGSELRHADEVEQLVFVAPLTNDAECQQCHGTDHDLRGAIEVVLDTSEAARSRERLVLTGIAFGVATIAMTVLILYLGLRALVVRPVAEMGSVADRVGNGQLDALVAVRSADEIGRLGVRLNHMIGEIRKKLELSKFVSKATVGSVDAATSGIQRVGQRARMTVLFSDVRGFTAFSETVEPEDVVQMLNRYLEAQSEVVEAHGGDIDKFVGDELMAHFRGSSMEARAIVCAVGMLAAIRQVNDALPPEVPRLDVGIGINVGEVVFGAMGAKDRMDFTVIGDAVNLGARLCSAAEPGQVVVTAAVRDAAGPLPEVEFLELPPIRVKGKREPIAVFEARARA